MSILSRVATLIEQDQPVPSCFPASPRKREMKLIVALLLMLSGYAFAGCGSINDPDQRDYCEGTNGGTCGRISNMDLRAPCESHKSGGSCGTINDMDLRATCDAETHGGTCGTISNMDQRALCEAKKGGVAEASITWICATSGKP
jgi:hypothetical protein